MTPRSGKFTVVLPVVPIPWMVPVMVALPAVVPGGRGTGAWGWGGGTETDGAERLPSEVVRSTMVLPEGGGFGNTTFTVRTVVAAPLAAMVLEAEVMRTL